MPVVVDLSAWQAVRVVDAKQPGHGRIVQRERVLEPMQPARGDRRFLHPKPDAPAIHEPVAPAVVVQKPLESLVIAIYISLSDIRLKSY